MKMDLPSILKTLERLAPLRLAKSWDNVGLLVEPAEKVVVKKILLTNDFTEPVMKEALDKDVNMVITYHPLIFRGFKRVGSDWKSRIIAQCLRRNIAVYSPHTAWDSVRGGSSDWLLEAFKPIGYEVSHPLESDSEADYFELDIPTVHPAATREALSQVNITATFEYGAEMAERLTCRKEDLSVVLTVLQSINLKVRGISPKKKTQTGGGRFCELKRPTTVEEVLPLIKTHLKLDNIRLARAIDDKPIRKVGVCCGSGASLLPGANLDLYLTGEMSHHEVLDAVHSGTHIVLCDHSNTERGFLPVIKKLLEKETDGSGLEFLVSQCDAEPLKIV